MRRPLLLGAICLVSVMGFLLRLGIFDRVPKGQIGAEALTAGESLICTGQVYQKDSEKFYLRDVHIISQAEASQPAIPCKDNFICILEQGADIPLGRTVMITGTFQSFSAATNPGEFDSREYYRSIGIGGRIKSAVISAQGKSFWQVRETMYQLRNLFRQRLEKVFPEKEAAVMSALLLGDKEDLDPEWKEMYQRNGILHILSISSLHITMVGMTVYKLLRKCRVSVCPAAAAGSGILFLYGMMTGFSVSACRAVGMYLLRMAAEMLGRTYDMPTAMGVMAAILVMKDPHYLRHAGFLLSFTSMIGIGMVHPVLAKAVVPEGHVCTARDGMVRGVWERLSGAVLSGISISLVTLPVQLWFYYQVPSYSVLLNIIVLPFMEILMAAGFLALIPGLDMCGWADWLILQGFEKLCDMFDIFPFHTWNPGKPRLWQVAVYYLVLAAAVWGRKCLLEKCRRQRTAQMPGESRKQEGDRWAACRAAQDRRQALGKNKQTDRMQGRESSRGESSGVRQKRSLRESRAENRQVHGEGKPGERGIVSQKNLRGRCRREHLEIIRERMEKACGGRKYRIAAAACLVALLLNPAVFAWHPPVENQLLFLDVGQGDGILVRTASGENYLFDCGSSSRSQVGKYVLLPCLRYYGIQTLDAVILSHPDADHVNGVMELLTMGRDSGIAIKQLVLPELSDEGREQMLGQLTEQEEEVTGRFGERECRSWQIPIGYLSAGERFRCDRAEFVCLHPESGWEGTEPNAYSICVYGIFMDRNGEKEFDFLMTGDVEGAGEEALFTELCNRRIQGVSLLKAAHHGSKNSTSIRLLEQIAPTLSVISCGRNNRYGHPHKELLERLENVESAVVLTSEKGAVRVRLEGGALRVENAR